MSRPKIDDVKFETASRPDGDRTATSITKAVALGANKTTPQMETRQKHEWGGEGGLDVGKKAYRVKQLGAKKSIRGGANANRRTEPDNQTQHRLKPPPGKKPPPEGFQNVRKKRKPEAW